MTDRICLHRRGLTPEQLAPLLEISRGQLYHAPNSTWIVHENPIEASSLEPFEAALNCDINPIPHDFDWRNIKLVLSDMDSTLINIECIDEIADLHGIKAEISAITESAMQGRLDFVEALCRRVALLKGVSLDCLEQVYRERLRLNPGAQQLIQELKRRSIPFSLVSGGFTFFTDRLQQQFGLYASKANVLEIAQGHLTGKLHGKLVDANGKAEFLREICAQLAIDPAATLVIGDGANDLKMLSIAGLSVAYRAKPQVQAAAQIRLDRSGLDALCDLFCDPLPIHTADE